MIVTTPDGTRLNVVVEGPEAGPAVILSHSLGSTLAIWDSLAANLASSFRVVRYDSRGHGASDAPDKPYSNAILGADALAVMDAFGIGSAAFIGVSKGAMTGMWVATEAPERVTALVLANTATFIPNKAMWDETITRARAEGLEAIAHETLARWFTSRFQVAHPEAFEREVATMSAMPVDGYVGSCAVLRDVDLREKIRSITQPTLVVAGAEDLPVAVDGARAMVAAIPGAALFVVPDAAHLSPIENPSAFNDAVGGFLRKEIPA